MQIILKISEGSIHTIGQIVTITLPDECASASFPVIVTDAARTETRHLIAKSDPKQLKIHMV